MAGAGHGAPAVVHGCLFASNGEARGLGDVLLNYRYQLLRGDGRAARDLAARQPDPADRDARATASARRDVGLQVNVPVSKQFGDFYVHANAGCTWLPSTSSGMTHVGRQRDLARGADVQSDARGVVD